MTKEHTIRKLTEADFDAYIAIVRNAYPGLEINSAEEVRKLKKRLLRTDADPANAFYGLFRNGQMLGGMRLLDFTMNMFAQRVKAGGVGLVAVDLVHKKEKVARDMLHYFLRHYRAAGAPLALLYPFRPDFYKRMGFGCGTKISRYRVKPASLPRGASKAHITFVAQDDSAAVEACYQRYAERTHGMIHKSALELERIFDEPQDRVVGYSRDGEVRGYIIFTFKREHQSNHTINSMQIKELVYEDRAALAELLTFLHTQADQISHIDFVTADEDFYHLLFDPRDPAKNLIPSVYHECNTQGVGLMYRVVDTRGIFAALSEHNFGGQSCKLSLVIADSFLPENAESLAIQFANGVARLCEDDDCEVEVSLDIAEFSSLIVGAVGFRKLYEYGLANISDARYVDKVDKIFAAAAPPICMTHF